MCNTIYSFVTSSIGYHSVTKAKMILHKRYAIRCSRRTCAFAAQKTPVRKQGGENNHRAEHALRSTWILKQNGFPNTFPRLTRLNRKHEAGSSMSPKAQLLLGAMSPIQHSCPLQSHGIEPSRRSIPRQRSDTDRRSDLLERFRLRRCEGRQMMRTASDAKAARVFSRYKGLRCERLAEGPSSFVSILHSALELRFQRTQRVSSVRYRVLLILAHFGKRLLPSESVGQKHRIVAESFASA